MTDDRKPGQVRIVRDLATGKVIRVETVLADGALRVLYPLTAQQIADLEHELTAPRH